MSPSTWEVRDRTTAVHKNWGKMVNIEKSSGIFCGAFLPPRSHRLLRHKYELTFHFQFVAVFHIQPVSMSMLKAPCNAAADHLQVLAQCRPPAASPRRRIFGVSFSAAHRRAPVVAVLDRVAVADGAAAVAGSLADRLRLGSLTEDGLSYKERFIVRCYEVGINKTATVETIANLLQVSLFVYAIVFVRFD